MSRLVTQLVTDEPAVVLVGEHTTLREKLAVSLRGKNVAVQLSSEEELLNSDVIFKLSQAYKVIWLCDSEHSRINYLKTVHQLSQVSSQIIVIVPVFTGIAACTSDLLLEWVFDTKKQEQFIIDCNYHLPSASFIFGKDIVGNNVDRSIFKYIFNAVEKNIIIDPMEDILLVSIDDFVTQAVELVFIPKKQVSSCILGKPQNSTQFVSLVKKLYDAYHNTNIEIVQDKVSFVTEIPFSVLEKKCVVDTRAIATFLVTVLPAPNKTKVEAEIPAPLLTATFPANTRENSAVPVSARDSSFMPLTTTILQNYTQTETTVKPQFRSQLQPQVSSLPQSQSQPQIQPQLNLNAQSQPQSQQKFVVKRQVMTAPYTLPQQEQKQFSHTEPISSQSVFQKPETKETEAETDINQEIQRIFKDTRTEQKVERVEKIVKSTKTITKKTKRRTKLFYGGLLSIGMAIGMIILTLTYLLTGSIVKKQVISYLSKTAETQNLAIEPGFSVTKMADIVQMQTSLYSQIIEVNAIAQNAVLVSLVQEFKVLPGILVKADKAAKNLVINILSGSIGNTTKLTEILTQSVSEAYEKLSLIQATLEQIDLGENSEKQQAVITQIGKKIQEIRYGLEIHQELQQVLPDMVGMSGKRTYALLLQNNQELRPTGGFIQAIALLNFDEGSLVSYQVYSVYELDKKLPGQVVPPEEIRLLLGEENWYLRDSNWDPDFSRTGNQVAWFIEKTLGVTVDGVFSMNVYSLEGLLKAVGPIDLPEYNEVITDKNIEERMEFHSEVVLVDSPKAVDYSVKVLSEILAALSMLKEESVPTLLSSLNHSLETKQTQAYSKFDSEQSIMQTLGWTGTLSQPACPSRLSVVDCSVDTITQVEANIGINKANYYLDRTIDHNITVSKTAAQHTRTIVFTNKAQSNSWPKGTYKTFIRFYINHNSNVEKVSINGSELTTNQITRVQENGYSVIGVRVDVPIQKQVTVEFVYSTPLVTKDAFSYVFYNRKQSGIGADPFSLSITYTPDIKPVLIAPSATISGNTISFSTKTLDDASLFGVEFE